MRRTNFMPDAVNCELPLDNRRSPGYRRVEPFMTGNTFYLWIGQHENGRYSKAHAHTSAAVLVCLKGKGYTYTWPEQYGVTPWKDGHADKIKRVDYDPFGMVSAAPGGARWYHQHFGVSKEPLRLTAWFGPHNPAAIPARLAKSTPTIPPSTSRRRNGDPLLDGRPYIKKEYEEHLIREGVENRMRPEYYDKNYKGELPREQAGTHTSNALAKARCRLHQSTHQSGGVLHACRGARRAFHGSRPGSAASIPAQSAAGLRGRRLAPAGPTRSNCCPRSASSG